MATGGNAIRGTRVGAGPMGEQDHGFHAERIVRNAARQIGVLAMRLKQVAPRVSLLGGLAAPLGKWLEPKVREQLTPPAHDAVAGALLLARRETICAQSRDAAARTFSSA